MGIWFLVNPDQNFQDYRQNMDNLARYNFIPCFGCSPTRRYNDGERMIDASAAYTMEPSYAVESAASWKPKISFYSCSTMVGSLTTVDPMEYPTLTLNAAEDPGIIARYRR